MCQARPQARARAWPQAGFELGRGGISTLPRRSRAVRDSAMANVCWRDPSAPVLVDADGPMLDRDGAFTDLMTRATPDAADLRARHVSIVKHAHRESVGVVIEDDGVGFDVRAVLGGPVQNRPGLTVMEERVRPFGAGSVTFESSEGEWTTVFVQLPAGGKAS